MKKPSDKRLLLLILALGVLVFLLKQYLGTQSYVACGCGCCNIEPEERCLYHSKGDDLQRIIAEDKKMPQSQECYMMGCSLPIKYLYCD